MNEGALGLHHRLFNGVELLGDIQTRSLCFDHPDDAIEMTPRALQALDDLGVR